MFITGLIVGLILGVTGGVVIAALCRAAADMDDRLGMD